MKGMLILFNIILLITVEHTQDALKDCPYLVAATCENARHRENIVDGRMINNSPYSNLKIFIHDKAITLTNMASCFRCTAPKSNLILNENEIEANRVYAFGVSYTVVL